MIKVQFKYGHVDLGSALVARQAIEMRRPHVMFLRDGEKIRNLFARDFSSLGETILIGVQNKTLMKTLPA